MPFLRKTGIKRGMKKIIFLIALLVSSIASASQTPLLSSAIQNSKLDLNAFTIEYHQFLSEIFTTDDGYCTDDWGDNSSSRIKAACHRTLIKELALKTDWVQSFAFDLDSSDEKNIVFRKFYDYDGILSCYTDVIFDRSKPGQLTFNGFDQYCDH